MDAPVSLALAERVAVAARELGIATALIGASALAAHHYRRGTRDVDLGSHVDLRSLRALEAAVRALGLKAALNTPDEDDSLGGLLVVWEDEDDEGDPLLPVEVVNFGNPHRPRPNPGRRAIDHAVPLEPGSPLRFVTLPDLVALKLYSGSRRDLGDLVELLAWNPDADRDEIRAVAGPFDATGELETLFAEADVLYGRRYPDRKRDRFTPPEG